MGCVRLGQKLVKAAEAQQLEKSQKTKVRNLKSSPLEGGLSFSPL